MSLPARHIRFSLVVATLGRSDEPTRLLASLSDQTCRDFEVIVVDQNGDDRLIAPIEKYRDDLEIVHLRTPLKGVCRARNLGASQARGEWLMFPDDDCWYPADLLERYLRATESKPGDFYCGRAANEDGRTIMGKFEKRPVRIRRDNVWTTLVEWMLLVRRGAFELAGGFDEMIGPGSGTRWGAYEVQDLALTLVARGSSGHYDPALIGHHPEDTADQTTPAKIAKMRIYSTGLGYVMRKHGFGFAAFLPRLLRPTAGIGFYVLRGRPGMARRSRQILLGRWDGWRST